MNLATSKKNKNFFGTIVNDFNFFRQDFQLTKINISQSTKLGDEEKGWCVATTQVVLSQEVLFWRKTLASSLSMQGIKIAIII